MSKKSILEQIKEADRNAVTAPEPEMTPLVGQTIKEVRPLNASERRLLGIESYQRSNEIAVIVLSSGAKLIPMRDFEMNGAGVMMTIEKQEVYSLFFQKQ